MRYVALFRGVNVGKGRRISMSDLRATFEHAGMKDVTTILNSGNVVFSSRGSVESLAATIEKAVESELGVPTLVTVLSSEQVATAIEEHAIAEGLENPSRYLLAFFRDGAPPAVAHKLAEKAWRPEGFAVGSVAAYLWMPDGIIESPAGKALAKEFGNRVTSRNWSTMLKIQAALESTGSRKG